MAIDTRHRRSNAFGFNCCYKVSYPNPNGEGIGVETRVGIWHGYYIVPSQGGRILLNIVYIYKLVYGNISINKILASDAVITKLDSWSA